MKKYFYCYSVNLKDFFKRNGLSYICWSKHNKTNKKYWIFESGEEIDKLLHVYRNNRPKTNKE